MAIEIERKFLLINDDWKKSVEHQWVMRQGYLSQGDKASVRVRIQNEQANINIKSMTVGIKRAEYEYSIPLVDANEMLDTISRQPIIEKIRYHVRYAGKLWEIDEFQGDNSGLVVAEIELNDINEDFSLPSWVGKEVSSLTRYYNVSLVHYPFSSWNDKEKG